MISCRDIQCLHPVFISTHEPRLWLCNRSDLPCLEAITRFVPPNDVPHCSSLFPMSTQEAAFTGQMGTAKFKVLAIAVQLTRIDHFCKKNTCSCYSCYMLLRGFPIATLVLSLRHRRWQGPFHLSHLESSNLDEWSEGMVRG